MSLPELPDPPPPPIYYRQEDGLQVTAPAGTPIPDDATELTQAEYAQNAADVQTQIRDAQLAALGGT